MVWGLSLNCWSNFKMLLYYSWVKPNEDVFEPWWGELEVAFICSIRLRMSYSILSLAFSFESWRETMFEKTGFNSVVCFSTVSAYMIMTSCTIITLSLLFEEIVCRFTIIIFWVSMNLESDIIFIIDKSWSNDRCIIVHFSFLLITREKALSMSSKEFIIIIWNSECVNFSFNPLKKWIT